MINFKLLCMGLCYTLLPSVDAAVTIKMEAKQINLQMHEVELGLVLEEIFKKFKVKFHGLENRVSEPITFLLQGDSIEVIVKKLLRYLNESNYAFEFNAVQLTNVAVLPKSKTNPKIPMHVPKIPTPDSGLVTIVQVLKIIKGTQAANMDIKKNDLIVSYNGTIVSGTQDLIRKVKQTAENQTVEVVIVRKRNPIHLYLNGGFIGVRINNIRIPSQDLKIYIK